ncbi:MAG: TRAM domain-containing protein [archaeon]
MRTESTAPVKEGETLDVRIEAVGSKGDGMARHKGFVLFVPNVKVGDEVHIRVTKVLQKSGFAEVVSKKEKKEEPKQEEIEYDPSLDSEDFGEEEEK